MQLLTLLLRVMSLHSTFFLSMAHHCLNYIVLLTRYNYGSRAREIF